MNAIEFKKIMDSDGLEMTKSVMIMLHEAKENQKAIKQLRMYQHIPLFAEKIQQLDELKDKAIWQAIEVANLEKMYGFRLIEDRDSVITATYNVSNPNSETIKKIRRHIQIMAELEKEICF